MSLAIRYRFDRLISLLCFGMAMVALRLDRAMTTEDKQALKAYSLGDMSAIELRRRLDGATYGDILRLLSEADLPLPRAPVAGREEQINRARAWMFPKNVS